MGAMAPSRWHAWQARWRMGATSRVNVTSADCAAAVPDVSPPPTTANPTMPSQPRIRRSMRNPPVPRQSRVFLLQQ